MRVLKVIKSSTSAIHLSYLAYFLIMKYYFLVDSTQPRRRNATDGSNDERAVSKVDYTIRVDLQQQTAPPTTLDPLRGPSKWNLPNLVERHGLEKVKTRLV